MDLSDAPYVVTARRKVRALLADNVVAQEVEEAVAELLEIL